MKEIHLIDTNILVYAFDNSEKKKHRAAVDLLKKCFDEKEKFAISSQNLAEFFMVMSSKVKSKVDKKTWVFLCASRGSNPGHNVFA